MTLTVDFWHLVGLLLTFIGSLVGFGKLLLAQLDKRQDAVSLRVSSIEKELADHKARLPLEYQRREDAIRFETVLNAKLDAIGGRIERILEQS